MPLNPTILDKIKFARSSGKLNLQNQNLTDDDILELVNILQNTPEIKELDITNNQIRNRGAQILANNNTIRKLCLYKGNPLTIESLRPFLQNTTIIEFPIIGGSGNLLTEIRRHITSNKHKLSGPVSLIQPLINNLVQPQPTIPKGNPKLDEVINANKQPLQTTINVNNIVTHPLSMPITNHTHFMQERNVRYMMSMAPINSSGDIYHILSFLILVISEKNFPVPNILLTYDAADTKIQIERGLNFAKALGYGNSIIGDN